MIWSQFEALYGGRNVQTFYGNLANCSIGYAL